MSKLWGGRFEAQTDELVEKIGESVSFDARLAPWDIRASIAHARMLGKCNIIPKADARKIIGGLQALQQNVAAGKIRWNAALEDVHTNLETALIAKIGDAAKRLHTARSRNDQIATDVRLWARDQIDAIGGLIRSLQSALLDFAEAHLDVIMPGYTHLQQAQPVRFSHWLLSYGWMLQRDKDRLNDLTHRVDVLPLGSGARAGNPLGIDREFLAAELGFAGISANSMDAVADRDYLIEFLSWAAILQVHLSRLAEDLLIYSSREFGFVEIADAYSTGSSLMPQKKNADSLELLRGKTGRVVGHLTGLLTVLKGLPSTYNKDLQEDKEPVFDTVDTLLMTLPIAAGVISTLKVDASKIYDSMDSAMLATELADYLVRKGMPFRQAHHLVGQIVQQALAVDQPLSSFPLAAIQQFSPLFERDVHQWLTFNRAADRRTSPGGAAESAVRQQWETLRALVVNG